MEAIPKGTRFGPIRGKMTKATEIHHSRPDLWPVRPPQSFSMHCLSSHFVFITHDLILTNGRFYVLKNVQNIKNVR